MLSSLLKHREALLGAVIILMIVAIGSRVPSFIAPGNLVEMFNDTAILIVLALGQMMVLLTKGIDLSMAANLALTGMIVALINFHYPDVPVWALLILASVLGLLMGYFLRYSRTGRALYTAGGNATAAYYTGINAGKMQFISFCLSGLLAGFCGYLWISRFAVAYVDVANGFELQVVAACVIGGISTMGGTGRVLGCLFGALFLGVINNALPVIGVSPFWQMAISGAVIVIAVLLNEHGNKRKGRLILRDAALARQKLAVKS